MFFIFMCPVGNIQCEVWRGLLWLPLKPFLKVSPCIFLSSRSSGMVCVTHSEASDAKGNNLGCLKLCTYH